MSQRKLKLVTTLTMELGKNMLSYYPVPFINFVFFKSIQISVKNDLGRQLVLTKIWTDLMSPPKFHLNNPPFWNGKLRCQEETPIHDFLTLQVVPCLQKCTPEISSNQVELLENRTSHFLQLKTRSATLGSISLISTPGNFLY